MPNLCALVDVKNWLALGDNTGADSILTDLIASISERFFGEIMRPGFYPAKTYTELRKGNDQQEIFMRHWPINSVTSVTIGTTVVPASPDGGITSGWWFDADQGPESRLKISLTGYWFSSTYYAGASGSGAGGGSASFPAPVPFNPMTGIQIVYNAGYADAVVTDPTITLAAANPTVQVQQPNKYTGDGGVKYANGTSLVLTTGIPAAGHYAVDSAGNYTFAVADASQQVAICYTTLGVPLDVQQAVRDWVAYEYDMRTKRGVNSRSMAGGGNESFRHEDIPSHIKPTINRYAAHSFGASQRA